MLLVSAPSADTLWRLVEVGLMVGTLGLTALATYRRIAKDATAARATERAERKAEEQEQRARDSAALEEVTEKLTEMREQLQAHDWTLFGMDGKSGVANTVQRMQEDLTAIRTIVQGVDARFVGVDRDLKGIRQGFETRFNELRDLLKAFQGLYPPQEGTG